MTTIDTLFGPEEIAAPKPRQIKFKQIKAVYETLIVKKETSNYLKPHMRYTSALQVHDTLAFCRKRQKNIS